MDAERYFRKFKDFCFLEFGSRIWIDLNISEDCIICEILKAKLQLIDKNKKDILGKLKIFASWNLDQEFGSIRIFLKIVYHFEILKTKL